VAKTQRTTSQFEDMTGPLETSGSSTIRPTIEQPRGNAASQEMLRQKQQSMPLPADVRGPAQQALGMDFSDVRVHLGTGQAEARGAAGLTDGRDIFVGEAALGADGQIASELLAHELIHLAQQAPCRWAAPPSDNPSEPTSVAAQETEAHGGIADVLHGQPIDIQATTGGKSAERLFSLSEWMQLFSSEAPASSGTDAPPPQGPLRDQKIWSQPPVPLSSAPPSANPGQSTPAKEAVATADRWDGTQSLKASEGQHVLDPERAKDMIRGKLGDEKTQYSWEKQTLLEQQGRLNAETESLNRAKKNRFSAFQAQLQAQGGSVSDSVVHDHLEKRDPEWQKLSQQQQANGERQEGVRSNLEKVEKQIVSLDDRMKALTLLKPDQIPQFAQAEGVNVDGAVGFKADKTVTASRDIDVLDRFALKVSVGVETPEDKKEVTNEYALEHGLSKRSTVTEGGKAPGSLSKSLTHSKKLVAGSEQGVGLGRGREAQIIDSTNGLNVNAKGKVSATTKGAEADGSVGGGIDADNGLNAKTTFSANGKFFVDVKRNEETGTYLLTVSFTGGVGVQGSGGYDSAGAKGAEPGQAPMRGGANQELGLKGSVDPTLGLALGLSRTRSLTAEAAKAYLSDVDRVDGGGTASGGQPEFQVWQKWMAAGDMLKEQGPTLAALGLDADGLAQMKEGEEISLSATVTAGVAASGSGSNNQDSVIMSEADKSIGGKQVLGGGSSYGVTGGISGSYVRSLSAKPTLIVGSDGIERRFISITVSVDTLTGWTAGGTVSQGGMSGGGVSAKGSSGKGQSATFLLDPKAGEYAGQYDLITGAKTPDQIRILAKNPALHVSNRVASKSSSEGMEGAVDVLSGVVEFNVRHNKSEDQSMIFGSDTPGGKADGRLTEAKASGSLEENASLKIAGMGFGSKKTTTGSGVANKEGFSLEANQVDEKTSWSPSNILDNARKDLQGVVGDPLAVDDDAQDLDPSVKARQQKLTVDQKIEKVGDITSGGAKALLDRWMKETKSNVVKVGVDPSATPILTRRAGDIDGWSTCSKNCAPAVHTAWLNFGSRLRRSSVPKSMLNEFHAQTGRAPDAAEFKVLNNLAKIKAFGAFGQQGNLTPYHNAIDRWNEMSETTRDEGDLGKWSEFPCSLPGLEVQLNGLEPRVSQIAQTLAPLINDADEGLGRAAEMVQALDGAIVTAKSRIVGCTDFKELGAKCQMLGRTEQWRSQVRTAHVEFRHAHGQAAGLSLDAIGVRDSGLDKHIATREVDGLKTILTEIVVDEKRAFERAADAYGGNFFVNGSLADMIGDLATIARLHDKWTPLLAQLSDAEDRAGIKVPAPVRAKLMPRTRVLAAFKAQNRKEIEKWQK
jgi:hypothetical protein